MHARSARTKDMKPIDAAELAMRFLENMDEDRRCVLARGRTAEHEAAIAELLAAARRLSPEDVAELATEARARVVMQAAAPILAEYPASTHHHVLKAIARAEGKRQ